LSSYDATHDVDCLPYTSADPVLERMWIRSRGKPSIFQARVPVLAVPSSASVT
jgi:hypothetical protein